MKKSKEIAVNALSLALILFFTFVPISLGPLRLGAFMLLPVIVAAQTFGWKSAIFTSLALGLVSLTANTIAPVSPMSLMFRNPLVSVLPRLFIGVVSLAVYKGVQKLLAKKPKLLREGAASTISAICGVITNTGLVFLMIFICYFGKNIEGTAVGAEFFLGLLTINFVIELAINALLVFPLVSALKKALRIVSKPTAKKKLPTDDINVEDKNAATAENEEKNVISN